MSPTGAPGSKRGPAMKLDRRKLDLLLAEQTMTYTEMARECGLGYSNLHALLRRKSNRPATIGRIADALGVEPWEIIQKED